MYESGENYLETILLLTNKNGKVRSVDIANHLGFSKPSVSRAMNLLKNSLYIIMEPSGNILLTDKGLEKASEIYERHQLITKYLVMTLGVSEEIAATDACRIEHVISAEVFEKIKQYTL
ncbi:MAG: metal-dependent transcriptional regulator [Oscillospiraceae bacterium]